MNSETTVFSINGEKKEKISLPSVFSIKPNKKILHDVVRMHLANKRQGTASTKGRSDVRGGGRKPYRQKHTGRARAGTIRSPIWRGGGVVFGPKPRDYSFKVPKKVKRLAIRSAFSLKKEENALQVIENIDFDVPKTKKLNEILTTFEIHNKKTLFLIDKYSENIFLSARNIPRLKISLAKDANTYDILWSDVLLLTKGSIGIIQEIFREKKVTESGIRIKESDTLIKGEKDTKEG
ncbi:50S ribosomal protein L4 [candidate division WOR-3 bacterium]|nr:50S ribosomal protein L4 [candidate division WOR-3 bacterium]MCK4575214.1 50S ribosomal protein L4 [candidate division WOR-3 bacterium]